MPRKCLGGLREAGAAGSILNESGRATNLLAGTTTSTLQFVDLAQGPVHFSENDGADLRSEPKGTGLHDLRVFNWLDIVVKLCR
jgi:hypothetical protein